MVALTLPELEAWLDEARGILAALDPADPRYMRGVALVAQRQAEHERLLDATQTMEHTYRWEVRWARRWGVLEVRDVFTGEWLQVDATDVPDSWRWCATERVREARLKRGAA